MVADESSRQLREDSGAYIRTWVRQRIYLDIYMYILGKRRVKAAYTYMYRRGRAYPRTRANQSRSELNNPATILCSINHVPYRARGRGKSVG